MSIVVQILSVLFKICKYKVLKYIYSEVTGFQNIAIRQYHGCSISNIGALSAFQSIPFIVYADTYYNHYLTTYTVSGYSWTVLCIENITRRCEDMNFIFEW